MAECRRGVAREFQSGFLFMVSLYVLQPSPFRKIRFSYSTSLENIVDALLAADDRTRESWFFFPHYRERPRLTSGPKLPGWADIISIAESFLATEEMAHDA